MKHKAEYLAVRAVVAAIRMLPRRLAHGLGAGFGAIAAALLPRLRAVGLRNVAIAFPAMPMSERKVLIRRVFANLGRQLVEFCRMPAYSPANTAGLIRYEGLDHYLAARNRGKGVLVLTGHLGAWELSSFFHSLSGYPMSMVIRRLDNPLMDRFVNGVRCLHGNRVLHKDDFARGLLAAMHRGETVGILMDTNMTPPQGVFVPFFGTDACTASGLARVALRTDAAVLPGFLLWESSEQRFVLRFGSALELSRTGNADLDARSNTALFTATIEQYIRQYPDQWLWVHRRWKTRPAGERSLYA